MKKLRVNTQDKEVYAFCGCEDDCIHPYSTALLESQPDFEVVCDIPEKCTECGYFPWTIQPINRKQGE